MGSRVGMSVGLCCMGVRHGSEVGMGSGVGTGGSVGGAHVSYIVCCVCTWGDAVTLLNVPGGENRVVKEF